MHQRTLNFRREPSWGDTGRKQSALKQNQEKIARLQGIQSTDGSDVADQTAARLGNLLIF